MRLIPQRVVSWSGEKEKRERFSESTRAAMNWRIISVESSETESEGMKEEENVRLRESR